MISKKISLLLVPFLLLVSCENTNNFENEETTNIMIATDIHYLSPRINDYGEYFSDMVDNRGDGKVTRYCSQITNAFVEQVIEKKPDALILSGDLTFNGARESHEDMVELLKPIKDNNIPIYLIPGNHDVYSNNAASFHGNSFTRLEGITSSEFREIYNDYYPENAMYDKNSLSYISEINPGLDVLMLDCNTVNETGFVLESTMTWIDEVLRDSTKKGKKVIAVTHQNLYQHNALFSGGYMILNGSPLFDLYEKYNVLCNLSGHIHIQHYDHYESSKIEEFVTSSLAITPSQYGMLNINGSKLNYCTEKVDVEKWAKEQKITDENLLNFTTYTHQYFYNIAYNQAYSQLGEVDRKEELARFFANANTLYFEGNNDQIPNDKEMINLWKEQTRFIATYFKSILMDMDKNYNYYVSRSILSFL